MKKNGLLSILLLIILNIIVSNPTISSNIRLIVFLVMISISIKKDYLLVYLLGTCNIIPFMNSISPLQIVMTVIMLKILYYFYNKKIKISEIFSIIEIKVLYILLMWLFICGLVNDFMVFKPYLLGLITTTSIVVLVKFNFMTNDQVARYFTYGLMQTIIIGYLSKFNILGFADNGFERLTLARGDANSNALIYGVIIIFSFITIISKYKVCNIKVKDVAYIIITLLGLNLLLTSASRGAFISLIITLIIFIILNSINMKMKVNKNKKMLYVACTFLIISITIIVMYFRYNDIGNYLNEKYEILFSRLTENKEGLLEGDIRYYLYMTAIEKSISRPIFGFGMSNFMNITTKYPHNTYLDYLTAGGFLGLLIYLVFIIRILTKSLKINISKFNYLIFAIIMCNIYLAMNSATFSAIGDKIIWVLYAILIIYINENSKCKE